MESSYQPKIDYYVERRFGEKVNATFEFFRENWRRLFKIILIIDGPLVLLFGVSYVFFLSNQFLSTSGVAPSEELATQSEDYSVFVLFISGFFMVFTFFAILYRYMKLYESFSPEEIKVKMILKTILPDTGIFFLLYLIVAIMLVAGFFILLIPGIYLSVVLTLAFPILIFEDYNIFRAIKRAFHLIHDHWWSTFGLLLIMYIIQTSVGSLFILPMYSYSIYEMVSARQVGEVPFTQSTFKSILIMSLMMLFYLGAIFTYCLGVIASTFQYFNLREKREAVGLLARINKAESAQ